MTFLVKDPGVPFSSPWDSYQTLYRKGFHRASWIFGRVLAYRRERPQQPELGITDGVVTDMIIAQPAFCLGQGSRHFLDVAALAGIRHPPYQTVTANVSLTSRMLCIHNPCLVPRWDARRSLTQNRHSPLPTARETPLHHNVGFLPYRRDMRRNLPSHPHEGVFRPSDFVSDTPRIYSNKNIYHESTHGKASVTAQGG